MHLVMREAPEKSLYCFIASLRNQKTINHNLARRTLLRISDMVNLIEAKHIQIAKKALRRRKRISV